MDKPSQTKPYAGLVIYRIQRNVEYLLLNDSFANKKHWFCPKGQVLGSEDEIKCALRETFEATGLRPSDLRIEEGFSIELKYLSGTKPKRVKYHLAQLLDSHVRLLPNAEGVHLQWFNQTSSAEKVIFKTMQEVFKHAQTFIESRQLQQRKKYANNSVSGTHHTGNGTISAAMSQGSGYDHNIKALSVGNGSSFKSGYKPRNITSNQQQQQQQQQLQQQQASPLYKTRLCERFETEGSCPYGPKCNFAHGISELRGRVDQQPQQPQQLQQLQSQALQKDDRSTSANIGNDSAGNQLFKTRLCEKFIKDKFCQYGPKCHFAHGEAELKERPKKSIEETADAQPQQQQQQRTQTRNYHHSNNENIIQVDTQSPSLADQRSKWRSTATGTQNQSENSVKPSDSASWRSPSVADPTKQQLSGARPTIKSKSSSSSLEQSEDNTSDRSFRESSWRPSIPRVPSPPKAVSSPVSLAVTSASVVKPSVKEENPISLDELRRPAFVEHQTRSNSNPHIKKAATNNGKEKKNAKAATETTEKSWMKIVKLSKEEQDELESQSNQSNNKLTNNSSKLAQTEAIIADLKKFFANHAAATTCVTKGKLMDDVKEVTKIEMRNDLSKKQLLYILLVSLLEEESDQSMLTILKTRDHLFKTLVKTNADQILLLKAWDSFTTGRKPIMVNKTAAALSHWYDCEMVEEEAFLTWYSNLEKGSVLEKKSAKFIEWLNESDSEEEED